MICVASFIVFSILGVFSAKYRSLAFEAYNCMLDRITLGECDAEFEDKVKATVIGRILDHSPRTARFLENHFQAVSIIFVVVFAFSFLYILKSLVFLAIFGSCTLGSGSGCVVSSGLI